MHKQSAVPLMAQRSGAFGPLKTMLSLCSGSNTAFVTFFVRSRLTQCQIGTKTPAASFYNGWLRKHSFSMTIGGVFMPESHNEELLTVQEVAKRLRVTEATVRRWIKNGSMDAIKLPHQGKREVYRIRRSTLMTVLKYIELAK